MRHKGVILGVGLLMFAVCFVVGWRRAAKQEEVNSADLPDNIDDLEAFRRNMHNLTANMENVQRNRRHAQS